MIEVLTNLQAEVAVAAVVAELYRGRWSVEGLFLRLTTVLQCEVNTLGYPPAALFGFRVALAAGNVYAAVKGALRAAHLARGANLRRYRKATRGPKKPKPPRTRFPEARHIATSRLLNGEQK